MAVTSTYRLADQGTRLVALIIDSILVGIIGGIFGADAQWLLGGVMGFVVGVGYQWFFLTRNGGQTPGKMLLGIRVVKTDGTDLTFVDSLLRYVGYLINSPIFMLGWLWSFWDPMRQGWHDKLARTVVVMADRESADMVTVGKRKTDDII